MDHGSGTNIAETQVSHTYVYRRCQGARFQCVIRHFLFRLVERSDNEPYRSASGSLYQLLLSKFTSNWRHSGR
jgi:hypothetical protein